MKSWKLLNAQGEEVGVVFAEKCRKLGRDSTKLEFLNRAESVLAVIDTAKVCVVG